MSVKTENRNNCFSLNYDFAAQMATRRPVLQCLVLDLLSTGIYRLRLYSFTPRTHDLESKACYSYNMSRYVRVTFCCVYISYCLCRIVLVFVFT